MASTTKIMTGILALEKGNPDDIVTVSTNAASVEGSSIYLEAGEKQRLEDLVYGIMLSSGNDAAIAIAEHIGGTVEEFSQMMTQKAIEIGALDTCFENPNGLPEEGHFTTAYDLAIITAYALKNKKFSEIVCVKQKKIPWQSSQWDRLLTNHNKLLDMYEGCDGVKTGFTKAAGRCLVSSATRNGWKAVAVTLNAPNDWQDHIKMFNKSFDSYIVHTVINKNEHIKTIPVLYGKEDKILLKCKNNIDLVVKKDETDIIDIIYNVPNSVEAPIRFGQVLGDVSILLNNVKVKSINLYSDKSIEEVGLDITIAKIIKNWILLIGDMKIVGMKKDG